MLYEKMYAPLAAMMQEKPKRRRNKGKSAGRDGDAASQIFR